MTTLAYKPDNSMRNYHERGGWRELSARLIDLFATWHARSSQRAQLARLSEYELHDLGLSRSLIAVEIEKPFWRR